MAGIVRMLICLIRAGTVLMIKIVFCVKTMAVGMGFLKKITDPSIDN